METIFLMLSSSDMAPAIPSTQPCNLEDRKFAQNLISHEKEEGDACEGSHEMRFCLSVFSVRRQRRRQQQQQAAKMASVWQAAREG